MKGYQNNNANHMNLNSLLSSNNSADIIKQFSQQFLPLEKSQSEIVQWDDEIDDKIWSSELGLTKSASFKYPNKKDQNFKVIVRVRPPLPREIDMHSGFTSITQISKNNKNITIQEYLGAEIKEGGRQRDISSNPNIWAYHTFPFDYVYSENSTQKFVYENTAKTAVLSVLEGYNATLLAYGQTGTGKTYTMEGFSSGLNDPQKGIIPRSMEEIFRYIESSSNKSKTFMVRASYLQIYNEIITDLLKKEMTSLQIREDKKKGIFVEGLSEWVVKSPHDIYNLMKDGMKNRATASTKMNDVSSRSHAIFIIIVEQMRDISDEVQDNSAKNKTNDLAKEIKVGKLNLVDLAGSERVRVTGATGKRLEESKSINQSLSWLGNVIAALTDK